MMVDERSVNALPCRTNCIGNPLRDEKWAGMGSDEQLSRIATNLRHPISRYSAPELAQSMAVVIVIMIDANHEGVPGELRIRTLSLF